MGDATRRIAPESLADGRYETGGLLGSGGMGIVVRARDHQLGRDVAIKLLADNLAMDADARERFTREARAAARLNHQNVVQIFDVGEEDERPYIVMELVEGPSLSDRLLDDRDLDPDELETIARQTLAALDHAHGAGLLHRDIKPANLLLDPEGTLKVTDFGVAEVGEVPGLTRTGHVLGTLPYLAPERLKGSPASPGSDLYALGATLHELATGSPPREGEPLPESLPVGLRELILACLAEDRSERPGSAADAVRLLSQRVPTRPIAADETVAIAPGTRPTPADTGPAWNLPEAGRELFEAGQKGAARIGGALRRAPTSRLVLGVLAVLVVLALIAVTGDQAGEAPAEQPTEAPAAESDVEPVERGADAAESARNVAEWIRQHSDG